MPEIAGLGKTTMIKAIRTKGNNLPGKGTRILSLFTGAGGLDLGFEQIGYETVYAGDIDHLCCETLKLNLGKSLSPKMEVVEGDIRKISLDSFPDKIDLVIGGPPCQSFSASGRRAGGAPGRLDDRGTLFEAYFRVIQKIRPKAFLFENVRGILGTNKGEDWRIIVGTFQKLGYTINYRVLDALDYGAPQQRERLIMVGHQMAKPFLFPEPLFGPDSLTKQPHVTAGEALKGLKNVEDLSALYLSTGKYSHLLPLVPHGDNYLYFTDKRGYESPIFAYRSRFSDFLYKANPNMPIKTIIASPGKYTGPFHWDNRRFSLGEYKRLQGFPDDYLFAGTRSDVVKQIGNSVSPHLSRILALAIAKQIFDQEADLRLLSENTVLSFDQRKGLKAKKTREHHEKVSLQHSTSKTEVFKFKSYETTTEPSLYSLKKANTSIVATGNSVKIITRSDSSRKLFAKMKIVISKKGDFKDQPDAKIEVIGYGESAATIQTMWNAVDDWVINSSNFHSLFELYGHFTEPHPIFKIIEFKSHTGHPIGEFSKHCSNFSNCSTYFDRSHLTNLFGKVFQKNSFTDLVEILRGFRFDIRCVETNITMPKDKYMVCYPFTLPHRKQMSFSIRKPQVKKVSGKKALQAAQ